MRKTLIALLCSSLTTAALAEDFSLDWNRHHGLYAEITAGTNAYYAGIFSSHGSFAQSGIEGASVGAALGYHFTPTVAIEVGDITGFTHYEHGPSVTLPYVTSRFDVPITSRVNFIAKVGAMGVVALNNGILLPFTGIGFSYAVTQKLELSAQYQGAFYGVVAAGAAGLGLTYHFE